MLIQTFPVENIRVPAKANLVRGTDSGSHTYQSVIYSIRIYRRRLRVNTGPIAKRMERRQRHIWAAGSGTRGLTNMLTPSKVLDKLTLGTGHPHNVYPLGTSDSGNKNPLYSNGVRVEIS